MSLVECFRKIINSDFYLGRISPKDGIIVSEKRNGNANFSLTFIGGKNIDCFGFTAEAGAPEPLALLASQHTPGDGLTGIRKMCDGIVIFSQSNQEYILGVEIKRSNTKYAHNQIQNGEILCKWLTDLLNKYGHWHGNYKFCSIIVKSSRKAKDKGTTRHNEPLSISAKNGGRILNIRNADKMHLRRIADSINQS